MTRSSSDTPTDPTGDGQPAPPDSIADPDTPTDITGDGLASQLEARQSQPASQPQQAQQAQQRATARGTLIDLEKTMPPEQLGEEDRNTPTDLTAETARAVGGGTIPSPDSDTGDFGLRWGGEVQLLDVPTGIAVVGSVRGGFDGEVAEDKEGMMQGIAISAARAVLGRWQGSLLDVDGEELEKQVCNEARPQLIALGFSGDILFDGLELAPVSKQALQAALASDAPLQPGAMVSVRWSDGAVYQATLVQVGEGQMLVTFPNGQQHWVSMDAVTPMPPPAAPSSRGGWSE